MKNSKVVILVVLGIIAISSLVYGLSAKPKWQKSTVEQGTVIKKPGEAGRAENVVGQTKRRAKRTQFRSWKRNPFVPKGVPGTAYSKLVLNGILASGKTFKAMIGDAIVGKGDKVEGNTVIEVKRDRVILNDGTKDFELKLEQ